MRKIKNLTLLERESIYRMHEEKKSLQEIANFIDRSKSTISKELRRNKAPKRLIFSNCYAKALYAQEQADNRKHQPKFKQKLKSEQIREYVEKHIRDKRSPRDIRIRVRKELGLKISHQAIYDWINNERKDLICFLTRQGRKRKGAKRSDKKFMQAAAKKLSIKQRPLIVEERVRFGDWEGDTIISRQSKVCIFTLTERKSRFTILHKLPACNSHSALMALLDSFYQLPAELIKTLTLDNGSENACHDRLALKTALEVYFCEAYASWQRGSVENTNGFIRRHFPKKTDFALVTEEKIKEVQDWLNTRMMDCLGENSPEEIFLPILNKYPNQIQSRFPHLGDIKQSFLIAT